MDTPLQVTQAQHSLPGRTSKGKAAMFDGVQACWYVNLMLGVQLLFGEFLVDCFW